MEQWFSSDLHFDHANIITFCNRPFADPEEMNEALIARHNALVKPEDHWTCLGDLTMARKTTQVERFTKLIRRMNGHKRLIMGNHDHFPIEAYLEAGFEKIYAMTMYDGIRFTHIPVHPSSMGQSVANVHGHIHDTPAPKPVLSVREDGSVRIQPYINISVELTDYTPLTLEQIKSRIQTTIMEANGQDS